MLFEIGFWYSFATFLQTTVVINLNFFQARLNNRLCLKYFRLEKVPVWRLHTTSKKAENRTKPQEKPRDEWNNSEKRKKKQTKIEIFLGF